MEASFAYGEWAGQARARGAGADTEDTDDDDDERSDDNPLLNYRYDKYRRYAPSSDVSEERSRRGGPLGALVKFSLFCTAMILFCVLMYIPMYNRVLERIPKDVVAGWNIDTNRDTKIYVQPYNITTIHQPRIQCSCKSKEKLYLLIVVCSDTSNFERRIAIRETWGSHRKYLQLDKIFKLIHERYKSYDYSYNLYPNSTLSVDVDTDEEVNRTKRDAGFMQLLPKIAEALKRKIEDNVGVTEERRFQEDEEKLAEFDMNKAFDSNQEPQAYDYDYDTNVMRIPPNGEQESPDLNKIMAILRKAKLQGSSEIKPTVVKGDEDTDVVFKLVFLLGLPPSQNRTEVQERIEMEVDRYGDVIQENFIDSYNNLTLKSIMMLKWVKHNCNNSLRYILKTDDDMYINTPRLLETLRNRSLEWDGRGSEGEEYLLAGDQIYGARPVLDAKNKWFSPRYMYGARVYPRYLSGTGYLLSVPAARALYRAALATPYFHLEDVFITGICAARATPRLKPQPLPHFAAVARTSAHTCAAQAHVTSHHVTPSRMRRIDRRLHQPALVDACERMRLTQVRKDTLRARLDAKKKLTALNARFKTNSRSGVLGL